MPGYDCQIVSPKSQYRDTDQHTEDSSHGSTYQQCKNQSWNRRKHITGNMGKQSTGIGSNAHKSCVSKTQLSGITDYQIQGKRCDNVHTDGDQKPVSSLDRFPVEERICTTTKIAITMPYVIKLFFVVLFIFFSYRPPHTFSWMFLPNRPDGFTSSTMIKTANTIASAT